MSTNPSPGLTNPTLATPPEPFGYKTAWFAIRTEDTKAVAAALELQNTQAASWQYGVRHAYESDDYVVFVSPPVKGWTLAMGTPILLEADDHAMERMVQLSRQFGEAQFFGSMRTSDAYIWGRASKGKLIRLFYEGDGNRRVQGNETDEEKALGVTFFDESSPQAKQPGYWERKDLAYPDEEYVLKIAGKWSVDPSKLNQMGLSPSLGLLGGASASYPPKPRLARPSKN